jgi:hypothetical protein
MTFCQDISALDYIISHYFVDDTIIIIQTVRVVRKQERTPLVNGARNEVNH